MTESEFNQRVDDTGANVDYETAGGILTLIFEDNSKIIINRQTPVQQIWVAAKSGGFHFDYDDTQDRWCKDSDGQELFAALSQYCSEQSGEQLDLKP